MSQLSVCCVLKPEGTQLEYSTSVFVDLTQSSSYSSVLNVGLPAAVVPGSEVVELTALGEFTCCCRCCGDDIAVLARFML